MALSVFCELLERPHEQQKEQIKAMKYRRES